MKNYDNKFPGLISSTVKAAMRKNERDNNNILGELKEMENMIIPAVATCIQTTFDTVVDMADLVLTNKLISDGIISLRDERLDDMDFYEKAFKFLNLDKEGADALKYVIEKELNNGED